MKSNRPDFDSIMMQMAAAMSLRSTCPRKSVGCVITHDTRHIVTGYNGALSGNEHCTDIECRLVKIDGVDSCMRAVHAERNAIYSAARNGVSLEGATCYVTTLPCWGCAQGICSVGISRVVFSDVYKPDMAVLTSMEYYGIKLDMMSGDIVERDVYRKLEAMVASHRQK